MMRMSFQRAVAMVGARSAAPLEFSVGTVEWICRMKLPIGACFAATPTGSAYCINAVEFDEEPPKTK